jgi:hypothetical protein
MRDALSSCVKRHFMLLPLFCMWPLQSATLERLSLDEMVAKSTLIVRGKVSDASTSASGPVIYTHYTIQVSERLKGQTGATVDIAVPGGTVNGLRQTFAGAPTLNAGDDFVFFLYTGRDGRTSILGLTQGLFALRADGSGDPMSTRSATSELMLDRKSGRPVKDEAVSMRLSELRGRIAAGLKGSK